MTKLSLNPNPTFQAHVDIPLHGGGSAPVKFTFKHRTITQLNEWRGSLVGKKDADTVMELADGWDLDDEFTRENVLRLFDSYAGAARAIFDAYLFQLIQAKAKN